MYEIYSFMERLAVLAVIGFTGEAMLPRGALRASAKRALSLILLLYAAEPAIRFLMSR